MKFNSTVMIRKNMLDFILFLYIALFVYAAVTKLVDFQKFRIQLGQSPMLTAYAGVIVWLIPTIELAASVLMIFERTRSIGLYAAFGMMVMFTTYIVLASRFSEYVPCSCGGVIENLTWTEHLVLNFVFVLLGVVGILCCPGREVIARHELAGSDIRRQAR